MAVVGAFMRIGNKYDLPQLHLPALQRLYARCLSKLPKFDALSEDIRASELIKIIDIARSCDALVVLPSIFYELCSCDIPPTGFHQSDQLAIRRGWQRMVTNQARHTFAWLDSKSNIFKPCKTRESCQKGRKHILSYRFFASDNAWLWNNRTMAPKVESSHVPKLPRCG